MCGRARFSLLAHSAMNEIVRRSRRQNRRNNRDRQTQNNPTNRNLPTTTVQTSSSSDRIIHTDDFYMNETEELIQGNLNANESISEARHEDSPIENTPIIFETIENAGPTMKLPVLILDPSTGDITTERMTWGMIPGYNSKYEKPDHFALFNKKIETIESVKYFAQLASKKRCLVVVDGFYEWKLVGGKKQPYYIFYDQPEPMLMAAIYEDSIIFDKEKQKDVNIRTFSVLTCEPSKDFQGIHVRQPVFITQEQGFLWLSNTLTTSEILAHIHHNREDSDFLQHHKINLYPVHQRMTDLTYQESDCAKEISLGLKMNDFFVTKETKDKIQETEKSQIRPSDNKPIQTEKPEKNQPSSFFQPQEKDNSMSMILSHNIKPVFKDSPIKSPTKNPFKRNYISNYFQDEETIIKKTKHEIDLTLNDESSTTNIQNQSNSLNSIQFEGNITQEIPCSVLLEAGYSYEDLLKMGYSLTDIPGLIDNEFSESNESRLSNSSKLSQNKQTRNKINKTKTKHIHSSQSITNYFSPTKKS